MSMNDTLPPLGNATIQGVTVRGSNGLIDFKSLRDSGFTVAYVRATAGPDYIDNRFSFNVEEAQDAGLEVGFLHYLTARTVEEARSEAAWFSRTIEEHDAQLRPAMRFDCFCGLTIEQVNAIAQAFLESVQQATGIAPMLYTSAEDANLLWNAQIASRYPLWVVDPDVAFPDVRPGKWTGWTGWQYGEAAIEGVPTLPLSLFTANVRAQTQGGSGTKIICVTVQYGDTLSAIARLFGTSVEAIARLNAIENPDRIFPGQRLYLRVSASTPVACCDSYTVRRGDTLTSIAARFSTTVARLVAINEISNPDLITVGQVLQLGLCNTSN